MGERRINELNRELLNSESEYEKTIFKTRIARLSGNISKIKVLNKSLSHKLNNVLFDFVCVCA